MEDNFRCKSTFCGIFSYFGVVFIFLVNDNDTLENDEEAHKVVLYTISYFLIFFICRGDDVKITMVEEDVYNAMIPLNTMIMIILTKLFCILTLIRITF